MRSKISSKDFNKGMKITAEVGVLGKSYHELLEDPKFDSWGYGSIKTRLLKNDKYLGKKGSTVNIGMTPDYTYTVL